MLGSSAAAGRMDRSDPDNTQRLPTSWLEAGADVDLRLATPGWPPLTYRVKGLGSEYRKSTRASGSGQCLTYPNGLSCRWNFFGAPEDGGAIWWDEPLFNNDLSIEGWAVWWSVILEWWNDDPALRAV